MTTIQRLKLYEYLKNSDLRNRTAQELAKSASAELGFPVLVSSVAYMRRQMGIKPKMGRPSSGAPIGLPPVICSACGSKPYRQWGATYLLRCGNWNCEHHKPQNFKSLAEWNRFHSQNMTTTN